jgi:hypothetical protein
MGQWVMIIAGWYNNDYVSNALRAIQNNIVGQGVKMQAQVMRARGPGAGQMDNATNRTI